MRASEIFDTCHERYRSAKAAIGTKKTTINLLAPASPASSGWRPDRGGRVAEYVADFELAGATALRRPEWSGRLRLFRVYFCAGVPYRRAIALLGVAPGTFDYWASEVKRAVGRELARRGVFPPGRYFRNG